jgi:flagellar biosynthesis/type III secretory pathway M-ring protein FliF/YscJ
MKSKNFGFLQRLFFVLLLGIIQFSAFAQDSTGTVKTTTTSTTTTTTTDWYMQPWVWIVGGAVFLIIIVALVRGNSSSDKEVSRTTVIKDKNY